MSFSLIPVVTIFAPSGSVSRDCKWLWETGPQKTNKKNLEVSSEPSKSLQYGATRKFPPGTCSFRQRQARYVKVHRTGSVRPDEVN